MRIVGNKGWEELEYIPMFWILESRWRLMEVDGGRRMRHEKRKMLVNYPDVCNYKRELHSYVGHERRRPHGLPIK
jgi:hypothetical protein